MEAATALSLARSVLGVVLSRAGAAVFDDVARLIGIPQEVDSIRRELAMMKASVEMASALPQAAGAGRSDPVRSTWVQQVRDLAYDVEDFLADVALYAARASSASSRAAGSWPLPCGKRRRIAERIRELKASAVELNGRNQRYRIAVVASSSSHPTAGAAEQAAAAPPDQDVNNNPAELALQESDIVGRSDEKARLTELLSGSGAEPGEAARRRMPTPLLRGLLLPYFFFNDLVDSFCVPNIGGQGQGGEVIVDPPSSLRSAGGGGGGALRVVSVWGIGGMGKSSLVRMVHNDPVLLDEFDCGAWVTVPHPLDSAEVIKRRLRKELGLQKNQDIGQYLKDKRYRVVVDDVLSLEDWDDHISKVFQFDNNKGSRIIVTTRHRDVAEHCARHVAQCVFELTPLGDSESMDLFCRKVYKTTKYNLPEDMAEQAKHILRTCHGLPLAISTIGGLLANKPKTSIEWRNLHEHLGAMLDSDLRHNITNVIISSYDGLPYHLKPIFLYLSIFPENHEIRRTRLLRRWMAEGFIAQNHDMPAENVGEHSYNKLINRSMIQPSNVSPGVRPDRCRVHSMVRQIILSKSIEENQLFLIEKQFTGVEQGKIRHLVVSRWKSEHEKLQNINLSYIRSLTVFGKYPASLISPKMRLLRVLDLEDTTDLENDDLRHIARLRHLRYLCVRGKQITELPSSLHNLRYLETLDIQETGVTQLPGDIAKLENLRYLIAGDNFKKDLLQKMRDPGNENHEARLFGEIKSYIRCNHSECCNVLTVDQSCVRAPKGIEKLRNLKTLGVVKVAKGNGLEGRIRKLVMNLTNLQQLGVTGLTEEEGEELCGSIGELSRLQRLEVRSARIKFLPRMEEPRIPRHLTSLRLCGRLNGMPEWISLLHNLEEVKLLGTQLKQEDIARLENLRNLSFLGMWENSNLEESLRFSAGKFPNLKFLDIDGLEKIRMVTIWEHAMPQLEQLWLTKCPTLHDRGYGLSGVQHLPKLTELRLMNCGEKQNLINALQEQVNRHPKRPKFLIGKSRIV